MINTTNNNKIEDEHEIHFLTLNTVESIDIFSVKKYRDIVLKHLGLLNDEKGLEIFSWCIMTNRIHLILRSSENFTLSVLLDELRQSCKKEIVKAILTSSTDKRQHWLLGNMMDAAKKNNSTSTYELWQPSNNPIIIEEASDFHQMSTYIHDVPVVDGIVENPEEYLYSSARNFYDLEGLIEINYYV